MTTEDLSGWETPCYEGIWRVNLWMHVPRIVLIAESIIAILGGIIFKSLLVPITMVITHFIGEYLTARDPLWLEIFVNSCHYKNIYEC